MLNATAWAVVSRSSSNLAKVLLLIVMMDVDDGSSANEQSLLDDHDDVLLRAFEESRGLHQEEEEEEPAAMTRCEDLVYQGAEARGFDLSAGRTWMYPTNYPVRTYQLEMVKSALFHNTLVCLPTGLGKTFIAAVVMYNFYRWYPQGKVIFMAPTRPLVHQQIDACYRVAGVPRSDTAEMTGNLPSARRAEAWRERRLFFLKPHVVSNDIDSGICPLELIKCVVVDEAYKATGNYSYCQVVNKLTESGCVFRVLALSATPGSNLAGVQHVVDNLRISRLELRSEESLDVVPYVHRRKVETVTVALTGYIKEVQERFFCVIESYVRNLLRCKVLYGSIRSLSKFRIIKFRDKFRSRPPPNLPRGNFQFVEADFAVCISLYHALELLSLHGLRTFVKYLDGVIDDDKGQPNVKARLSQCGALTDLLREVREKLGAADVEAPNPDVSLVAPPDGSCSQRQDAVFSHPKLEKLREVVVRHFEEAGASTRAMVFCQYRETVAEICHILGKHRPLVKPMSFVGQASAGKRAPGFTQRQQIAVVEKFRSGGYNALVSTCVGEEGLDIGDVDLIVCFDCQRSPVRLVQRMGRTGRSRDGRIVMLMTEGAELSRYKSSVSRHRSVSADMVRRKVRMADGSPRMVPEGLAPRYHEIHVTVPEEKKKMKKAKAADPEELPGAVMEIFQELKVMLKLERCRDDRCPVCCSLRCHVPPRGAGHPSSSSSSSVATTTVLLPSGELPDVDQLLGYLTPESIERMRAELLLEEEEPPAAVPPLEELTDEDQQLGILTPDSINRDRAELLQEEEEEEEPPAIPSPKVTLSFRLFDGDHTCDCVDSSVNEKRPVAVGYRRRPSWAGGSGERRTAIDPTGGSAASDLTRFPKLNFDTTNALDQLSEDLDFCEEEDDGGGNVSPTLCSSGVMKQLSQAARDASKGPAVGAGVTGRLSQAASSGTRKAPGSSCSPDGTVSPKLHPVSRRPRETDADGRKLATPCFKLSSGRVTEGAGRHREEISGSPAGSFLDDETVSPVLRSSGLEKRHPRAAVAASAAAESPTTSSFLADSSDSPTVAGAFPHHKLCTGGVTKRTSPKQVRNAAAGRRRLRWVNRRATPPPSPPPSTPDPARINFALFLHDDLLFTDDDDHQQQQRQVSAADDNIRPVKRRRRAVSLLSSPDDEDFIPVVRRRRRKQQPPAQRNAFIEYEAEVSRTEGAAPLSSDEEDRRFVNDCPTQASPDMEAAYLMSLRRPGGGGRFKITTPARTRRGATRTRTRRTRSAWTTRRGAASTLGEITVLEGCLEALEGESPPLVGARKKGKAGRWRRIRAATTSDSD